MARRQCKAGLGEKRCDLSAMEGHDFCSSHIYLAAGEWPQSSTSLGQPQSTNMIEKALSAVNNRREIYGSPKKNFDCIAGLWTNYMKARGVDVTFIDTDVAQMSLLIKVARLAESPHHLDSLIDVVGYAQCHEECLQLDPGSRRTRGD